MRLFLATLIANTELLPGVHLLEVHAPQLAHTAQPGQYCMLRCCDSLASDPLLRRAFFVREVEPERESCSFLVHVRGRGSSWLARQQVGAALDMLGPLGHGWTLRPTTRNLLLIGEEPMLAAVLSLARVAIEHELAVTLLSYTRNAEESYPPALLLPEIEYQVLAGKPETGALAGQVGKYLTWADAVCCAVSRETLSLLTQTSQRWSEKHFAQVILWQPLACATGACLTCQIETRHGPRLICRHGPVFAWSELTGW